MAEDIKIPVNVYSEMTPNPATMKYVSNKLLVEGGTNVEYNNIEETKGSSELASELFNFPFVKRIFIASNFVAITKTETINWDYVNMELREFVKTYIESGKPVILKLPTITEKEKAVETESVKGTSTPNKEIVPSEYDEQISALLEEYVKPAVESDGGAIDFVSFESGVVTVALRGACSGCPSSTMTLRGGIESLLKQHIPDVKAVVAEEL